MFNSKNEKMTAEEIHNSSNTIAKGTIVEGNIETFGNIRIEGRVKGNIKSKSKVVLGKSSDLEGNLLAQNAEIAGEVKGTLEVSEILILKPTSVINGDILTNKLIVESGATFNGNCKMGVSIKEIRIGENGQAKERPAKSSETPEGIKSAT